MTEDALYKALESSDTLGGNRGALRVYLHMQLARYEQEPEKGGEIAYRIAGLLGTRSIMRLAQHDPYRKILQLAGDLELPAAHRDSSSTWTRFAAQVRNLSEPD